MTGRMMQEGGRFEVNPWNRPPGTPDKPLERPRYGYGTWNPPDGYTPSPDEEEISNWGGFKDPTMKTDAQKADDLLARIKELKRQLLVSEGTTTKETDAARKELERLEKEAADA